MQHHTLGSSGIEVSEICLGSMTWGEQNSEPEAHRQLDRAVELGVNFIDTAELYPVPPRAETQGLTEQFIGSWLARRSDRDRLIIASKVAGGRGDLDYIRGGNSRFTRQTIEQALDDSLRRLQTDYLDLYYLHWPERPTNRFGQLGYRHQPDPDATPLAESLEALADLQRAGKIRAIGLSNETPWGLMHALQLMRDHDWPQIAAIQNPYSLLNRSFEVGLAEIAIREQCPLLAYSPLAFGMLSGKYADGALPQGARLSLFPYFDRYSSLATRQATERYLAIARAHQIDPAQMAIAFCRQQRFIASTIIGATRLSQLEQNIGSIELTLNDELLEQLDQVHAEISNPAP